MRTFESIASMQLAVLLDGQVVMTKSSQAATPNDNSGATIYRIFTQANWGAPADNIDTFAVANGNIAAPLIEPVQPVGLATDAETIAGTDATKAVTPAGLNSRVATTLETGLIELAEDDEVIDGIDRIRAVTPASLHNRTATTARTGIVELATNGETAAGLDGSRAVTPASLLARSATTTRTGLIELATDAEVLAGTDATKAVTPASLAAVTAGATVIDSGNNANGYWRLWSDGYREQWGESSTVNSSGNPKVLTFPIAFTNAASIQVQLTSHRGRVWSYGNELYARSETTTSCIIECSGHDGHPQTRPVFWTASGY